MFNDVPGIAIDGRLVNDGSFETFEKPDPATGRPLAKLVRGREREVSMAVESAHAAFRKDSWRQLPAAARGKMLVKFSEVLIAHLEELAILEARDVGKPISQARNDIRGAARYFEYYGGMADKILGSTIPVRPGALDFTVRQPYGVSAQIIPWNYPMLMAARGIAPSLAAGNCVVAKPAEDASLSLLRLPALSVEAGLPPGVLNVVTGLGGEAGAALVRHPMVAHVTFTGSVATGTRVMQMAAEGVKPVALELGGKSPNIVFSDANLDIAVSAVMRGIIHNAGQTCNSSPRLLVHRKLHDPLLEKLRALFAAVTLGKPLDDPAMGPLNSKRQLEKVADYLKFAADDGGMVESFGTLPGDPDLRGGFFVRPAIITGVQPGHRVFCEEIFGPVLSVTVFDDVEQAVELANGTAYGLNAGIFTQDISLALSIAQRVDAGQIYINGYGTGGAVEVPFGGFKKSGFSREKGFEGLLHYTQLKSITVHLA